MLCGIDPGLKGGLAFLDVSGELVEAHAVPTHETGKRKLVAARDVGVMLLQNRSQRTIIEDVWTRPGQGVVSSGNFMKALGALYGTAAQTTDVIWVTPQKWKKHFGLIGGDKEKSRALALALWPDKARLFRFKKDADKAEAALIARWYFDTHTRVVQELFATTNKSLVGA
jgi:crossover junction endodeoxyribonuclease RuvC